MPDDVQPLQSPQDIAKSLGIPLASDMSGEMTSMARRGLDTIAEEKRTLEPMLKRQSEGVERGIEESDKAFQKIEPFKPLPPPDQRQYQTDPVQSFFSLGSVVGILASAFTHQPWETSFNAAAAAINARNASDADAYKHAFTAWKENTNLMIERHKIQMDEWKGINEKYKNDAAARDGAIRAYHTKFGDEQHAYLTAAGLYGQAESLMQHRADTFLKLEENYPKVLMAGELAGATLDYQKAEKAAQVAQKNGDAAGFQTAQMDMAKAKRRAQDIQQMGSPRAATSTLVGLKLQSIEQKFEEFRINNGREPTPDEANGIIRKVTEDQTPPKSGTSPDAMAVAKFIEEHKDDHDGKGASADEIAAFKNTLRAPPRSAPAMTMDQFIKDYKADHDGKAPPADMMSSFAAEYRARGAAVQGFATGTQGNTIRSFNTLSEHLETIRNLGEALQNGDVQLFNRLANNLAEQTGSPAPTNLETAAQIVGQELVKAVVGAGGTGEEREKAAKVFSRVKSPDQITGAINTAEDLVHGQLVGLRRQFVDTTKKTEDDFNNRLTGAARKMLRIDKENPYVLQARDALKMGAPKDAVMKRLQELGIDPAGL